MGSMLTIVIPAYNEEESIGSTLAQTIGAVPEVITRGGLDSLEILVINDGSRDRTAAIVQEFIRSQTPGAPPVRLIQHEINRGYGAAIKTGFGCAQGDLLGFMDADGTCDPQVFGTLCEAIRERGVDIVIGSRMILPGSGMPLTRRIGNRLFAGLLSLLSASRVTDSASGMRVLRRESLPLLAPLPDGLHFTPAMSARALLDPNLKIAEIPMPYRERVGESKLGVVQDGIRFLSVILEVSLSTRPLRFFGTLGALLLLLALGYALYPVQHYLRQGQVLEWMIYRLLAVTVFATAGLNLITIGLLAGAVARSYQRLQRRTLQIGPETPFPERRWQRAILHWLPALGILSGLVGVFINRGVLWEYLTTGHIAAHWTYPVTGAFFVLTGLQLFSFGVTHRIFQALEDRQILFQAGQEKSPAEPNRNSS